MVDTVAPFEAGHRQFATLSPRLWQPLGRMLVERSVPASGERVLDACCGDGASAIPSARSVGRSGRVDAVDGAGALLEEGRVVAGAELPQLRFIHADVTTWRPDDGPYDLVQCGLGVFLLPDMDADCRRLIGHLREGGRFAVSAWRAPALREFAQCLIDAVEDELGETLPHPSGLQPSERVDSRERIGHWLQSLGLDRVHTWEEPFRCRLDADLAWLMVTGTGFRGMLNRFDPAGVERVRAGVVRRIHDLRLEILDAGIVIGVGFRDGWSVPSAAPR